MNKRHYAILLALLIISLPMSFAAELNLTWDANGNLITGDGKYRIYNGRNQLTHIFNGSSATDPLLETYKHHPTEERIWVKKVYNVSDVNQILETVMYVNENSVRIINSSGTFNATYVLHAGGQIAQNISGISHFISSDPGSAVQKILTDTNGNAVENSSYSPYGEILQGGSTHFDMEDRHFSSISGEFDFRARRYNPSWGTFTSHDTILQNVYDPQMLNRLAFERNSPYNYVDSDGHWIFAAIAVYAVVETLIDVVSVVLSYSEYKENPTTLNKVAFYVDIIEAVVPVIGNPLPTGPFIREIGKGRDRMDAIDVVTDEEEDEEEDPEAKVEGKSTPTSTVTPTEQRGSFFNNMYNTIYNFFGGNKNQQNSPINDPESEYYGFGTSDFDIDDWDSDTPLPNGHIIWDDDDDEGNDP